MKRTFPAVALLVALFLRLFLAFATPTAFESRSRGISWYNDELAHIHYVEFVARHREFPIQTNSVQVPGAFARGDFEYYQPPLAYVALAPAWLLGETFRTGSGWLFVRILDAFFGAATVLAAWLVARKFSPVGATWAAWLLALQPGFCFQGVLASNDPVFWLLGALFLLKTMDFAQGRSPWALAPLAGALLLTKSSGLTLLPLPFLAAAFPFPGIRNQSGPFVGSRIRFGRILEATAAIGVGLLLAFPWYLRSHHLYGSWMALEVGHGTPHPVAKTLSDIPLLKMMLLYFSTSMWYPMDMDWAAHPWPRTFFALTSLAWITPLALSWRRFREPSTWIPWAALLLGIAAMVPYSIRYCQSESRLLFHLFPAFIALWAVAVRPRVARWGTLAIAPVVLTWGWIFFLFFRDS